MGLLGDIWGWIKSAFGFADSLLGNFILPLANAIKGSLPEAWRGRVEVWSGKLADLEALGEGEAGKLLERQLPAIRASEEWCLEAAQACAAGAEFFRVLGESATDKHFDYQTELPACREKYELAAALFAGLFKKSEGVVMAAKSLDAKTDYVMAGQDRARTRDRSLRLGAYFGPQM